MKLEFLIVFLCLGVFTAERIKIHTQSTPTSKDLSFFPLRTNYLEFNVNVSKHANIILSTQYALVPPYYEIIFGGFGNTKDFIRKNQSGSNFLAEHKDSRFRKNEYQKVWISINHTEESVSAGLMNGRAIMHFQDENYIKMPYFGIGTAFGGIGHWDFDYNMLFDDDTE